MKVGESELVEKFLAEAKEYVYKSALYLEEVRFVHGIRCSRKGRYFG